MTGNKHKTVTLSLDINSHHVAKNVSMEEGIKEAREMITSGKALATMEQFIAETNAA